jgi:hypothetical protein
MMHVLKIHISIFLITFLIDAGFASFPIVITSDEICFLRICWTTEVSSKQNMENYVEFISLNLFFIWWTISIEWTFIINLTMEVSDWSDFFHHDSLDEVCQVWTLVCQIELKEHYRMVDLDFKII